MAKATLPTNFKDDILASSMGSKRRYNVINNSDGTISLEDVTDYTQVGSTFGAAQINATNAAANAAADTSKIIDDYDTLMANTQAGYMAGALAVKELNSNLKPQILSNVSRSTTGSTNLKSVFDISGLYSNYKNITIDNIIVKVKTFKVAGTSEFTWVFSYDQTSGKITVDSGQTGLLCYPMVVEIYIIK